MPQIEISESVLGKLRANADARHLPLDAYLDSLASSDAVDPVSTAGQLAAIESFARGMGDWSKRALPPGHHVDDSRDEIYPDRD